MAGQDERNLKDRFKEWLETGGRKSPKKPVPLYLAVVLLLGIILMIIGTIGKQDKEQSPDDEWMPERHQEEQAVDAKSKRSHTITETEKAIQNRLKDMLENISGVSGVSVMVNLDGSAEKVYEKNTTYRQQTTSEEDREGGQREVEDGSKEEQVVILRQGDQEEPLLLYTKEPKARGILVVADGVDNLKVKEWVVEAVTRVMDIPPHKVSVLPREREEGE